jgi:hypothetical protein
MGHGSSVQQNLDNGPNHLMKCDSCKKILEMENVSSRVMLINNFMGQNQTFVAITCCTDDTCKVLFAKKKDSAENRYSF